MSGEISKRTMEDISNLAIEPKSGHAKIAKLILGGFFNAPVSGANIVLAVREKFGLRWKRNYPHIYTKKFLEAGILHAVKADDSYFWVLVTVPREQALRQIKKGKKVRELEDDLFSVALISKLKKDFQRDLDELHDNFGRNGNATAFLLRKILEKLMIIVFGKIGKEAQLDDKKRPGGWVGLKAMIEIASREKINGVAVLLPHTADEIKGIKFLGDTAAHNPLVNVDMKTIIPQMPYVITAYEELAKRL